MTKQPSYILTRRVREPKKAQAERREEHNHAVRVEERKNERRRSDKT